MVVGGQTHAPAALFPGKETCYPLNRRLDGLQRRSGWVWKTENLLRPFEHGTAQTMPTRYAISAPHYKAGSCLFQFYSESKCMF